MTSADPTTLRALLAAPTVEQGPYAYAEHLAEQILGLNVAPHIIWAIYDSAYYGLLRVPGDPTGESLILRVEATEPGAERLEVNILCPADPTCIEAFDRVDDPGRLLEALTGVTGTYDDDPVCYNHDFTDSDDSDDDAGEYAAWPIP